MRRALVVACACPVHAVLTRKAMVLSNEDAAQCAAWLAGSNETTAETTNYMHAVTQRNGKGLRFESSTTGFASGARQDLELWTNFFKKRHARGKSGVYAEVAANHYKITSNSYFFDVCLGWKGICVEPNTVYHDELRTKRTCELVPRCVSSTANVSVQFAVPAGKAASRSFVNDDPAASGVYGKVVRGSRIPPGFKAQRIRCVRLADEFERLGVRHLDFLSLDVEGHDKQALQGIDFDQVTIDYILCEQARDCAGRLLPLGYKMHKLGIPARYRDVVFVSPSAQSVAQSAAQP
jgi:FkbM family methyltransferase